MLVTSLIDIKLGYQFDWFKTSSNYGNNKDKIAIDYRDNKNKIAVNYENNKNKIVFNNKNEKNNIETYYKDDNDGDNIFLKVTCCILSLPPPCLAKDPDLSNTTNIVKFDIMQSSLLANFMAVSARFLINAAN